MSKIGSSTPETADALFEGLGFLARLTELVPSILYVYDLEENRNVWGNRDLFVTLGYQREQIAAMGDRLLKTILHPDDWAAYECHRERLLQLRDGELAELEYRIRRSDGTWCWLYSREMVFRRSAGGGVSQIVGAAHDITHRREAEQALQDSESRYRTLFESNPHPMFVTDLETLRFLDVNNAAIAKYRYSRDEFLSMTIMEIRPPEDIPRLMEVAEERARKLGFEQHGLWRHRLKTGEVIDVEITSHALDLDGRKAALVLAHDVTERRRAERELRESESRFRIALAASPVVVFEQDSELRYTWIHNPAPGFTTDSVLGRTDEELLGKGGAVLSELKRHVLETGFGVRREVVLPLPSGRRDYDLVIEPVISNGKVTGVTCAAIDITDRIKAAQNLARVNRELEQFTSIASHDLKEPLRGIALLARFMLEDEPSLSSEGRTRLGRMGTLCDRLVDMINGLLEYARSGGERRNEPCDLTMLAHAAADKLAEAVGTESIELSIADDLPTIAGDPVLLERLFANLISNAMKHNREPVKRIWIGIEGDAIFVKDNGPGIDPREHERIFGLFHRLPGSRSVEGIGLGLPLVRNIVESHGGRIWVRSAPGEGATFLMHFPGAVFP